MVENEIVLAELTENVNSRVIMTPDDATQKQLPILKDWYDPAWRHDDSWLY